MATQATGELQIEIRYLPSLRVVCLAYKPDKTETNHRPAIRQRFEQVQEWVETQGLDPFKQVTVGDIVSADERLLRYDCCLEVPEDIAEPPKSMRRKMLFGGRYAVVTLPKEPEAITESIRRFHEEYVPAHQLKVDGARPTYEFYWADSMEYCVPLLEDYE